jgi:arginase
MPAACRVIRLIGAPADMGAGVRGASMGPQALRVAGLASALRSQGWPVVDGGDLTGPPHPADAPERSDVAAASPGSASGPAARHLPQVVAWNRAVFGAVGEALSAGHLPLLVGGDHALAIGSISAVAAHCRRQGRALRVLWLDAHTDVNTEATSPSGNMHGMPVACLLGYGPSDLTGWSGAPAALRPSELAFIGIRSIDPDEQLAIRQLGLRVFDMRHLDAQGMRNTVTEALLGLEGDAHLHLSLDLDCLDPVDAPGVGTPVRGGPTWREMQHCMAMIAETGCLGSVDVMELNPARDTANQTAVLAVDLLRSALGVCLPVG